MKFWFAKTHPLCPPVWLAVLTTEEELMRAHKWVATSLALKFGMNPHITDQGTGEPKEGMGFYQPVILGAKWLSTALNFFIGAGAVLMNPVGGLLPIDKIKPIREVLANEWPVSSPLQDEIVYVTKWPNGEHYYLNSSKDRVFPFDKLYSRAEVDQAVIKFAPGAQVVFKEASIPRIYRKEGD